MSEFTKAILESKVIWNNGGSVRIWKRKDQRGRYKEFFWDFPGAVEVLKPNKIIKQSDKKIWSKILRESEEIKEETKIFSYVFHYQKNDIDTWIFIG